MSADLPAGFVPGQGRSDGRPATDEPHAGHADCSDVLHRLYEYLDGELSEADGIRVAAHLVECAPCLAEHDVESAMKAAIRRCMPLHKAPLTLRIQIVEQITTFHIRRT